MLKTSLVKEQKIGRLERGTSYLRTLEREKTAPETALPVLNGRFEQYSRKEEQPGAAVSDERRRRKTTAPAAITVISNSAKESIHS